MLEKYKKVDLIEIGIEWWHQYLGRAGSREDRET